MSSLEQIKKLLQEHKEEIRQKYGIIILGIFGSYARGEQTKKSDIDILVEFEKPIWLEYFSAKEELEKILGIKVDLVRASPLKQKPLVWESVKEDLIYV